MESSIYKIHTDGGSRGNPGPAAAGYVVEGPGIPRVAHGEFLGIQTNNFAEYTAAIQALSKLKTMLGADKAKTSHVQIFADSELMVKQVKGIYKVKNAELMQLFIKLYNLRHDFAVVDFIHIRRELNSEADKMVNHALDREEKPRN